MSRKETCVSCKHFYLDVGSPGYSELTPGSDFDMECRKKKWEYERYGSEDEFRRCIFTAHECEEFEQAFPKS